ncbi:MAG: DUF2752 domain-containing protein [Sedimentisphaerales bacterium]|nr:DUF2752 domain-containing protein [Sedimentisphaerales bacterium]
MLISQHLKKLEFFSRASFHQRITASVVFLAIAASCGFSWLAATDKFDIGWWLGPCGFKQKYNLPCPTCGMTTSVLTFTRGQIFEAFYIQPAAALLCCVLIVIAFLAFFVGVFGVYFMALKRLYDAIKIKYIIVALIIIIAAGWAVMLARTMTA